MQQNYFCFKNSILKLIFLWWSTFGRLLHLIVESRDLSQAEKKILLFQAEQIHKMTTLFIPNGQTFFNQDHFE
jgi:hypothetical protein